MWSVPVTLPAVQTDFGIDRAAASLPYALTMIGFAISGIGLGRLMDRFGASVPLAIGAILIGSGYIAASFTPNIYLFAVVQGALIGGGASAFFGPLMADISMWFWRRRGIAVGICAASNYVGGMLWPKPMEYLVSFAGWRFAYVVVGVFCLATLLPGSLLMRRRLPRHDVHDDASTRYSHLLDLSPNFLTVLLFVAGIGCCVAMAMPQVHIVAYCSDLGYGVARGAEMLSLMLGFGIVSRLASGFIADRIGGVATLLIGSTLQVVALLLYYFFDGLYSLYFISALFGLFQGGIVSSYPIIVREYFPAKEAGARVGIVLMATLLGMALGGWLSGEIFDLTGSYRAAIANGLIFNALNLAIVSWLFIKSGRWTPSLA